MKEILKNFKKESIYYDFISKYFKYRKEYNNTKKFAYFMQVGSFYELYSWNLPNMNLLNDMATEISKILLLYKPKKNNSKKHDYQNPFMMGFQISYKDKYLNTLLQYGYTVIFVGQRPDNKQIRDVIHRYTPGTDINNININQYIMAIYISEYSDEMYSTGISIININSYDNYFYECIDNSFNSNEVFNILIKIILQFNPNEFIIYNMTKIKNKNLINKLGINDSNITIYNEFNNIFKQLDYQQNLFNSIYNSSEEGDYNNIFQKLNLQFYNDARLSFTLLIEYIKLNNPIVLNYIDIPYIINFDNNLNLVYNTAEQLNIISDKFKKYSILSIIDYTSTNMGKRLLKQRLLNPLNNIDEININYELIDSIKNENNIKMFEEILEKIPDITRKFKKLYYFNISPYELFFLNDSLNYVIELINYINDFKLLKEYCNDKFKINNMKINIKKYIQKFNKIFNYSNLKKCRSIQDSNINIFQDKLYEKLDKYIFKLNEIKNYRNELKEKMDELFKNNSIKKYENKIDKKLILITKTKLKCFEKNNKDKNIFKKIIGSKIYITSTELETYNSKEEYILNNFRKLLEQYYLENIKEILKSKELFKHIELFISFIDFIKSGTKCAIQNYYVKPIIKDSESSFFDITDFKHPIIEKVNNDIPFVSNSLRLDNKSKGMILSGFNGQGKSSLMKNIGILIVMAQIGYFVPAKKMIYHPFNKILTRIKGNDNIFTNSSSYMIEIEELKNIINKADKNSLILIDELCKGSEYLSASALTISVINDLIKNKESIFILTTHLHNIYDTDIIKNLIKSNDIIIKSFEVEYTNINGVNNMIFKRKLKDGKCDSLYGLEIAKYLGLNDNIISLAHKIRNDFINVNNKKVSKYNSKVIIDKCNICNSTKNLEVDHIIEQNKANKNGYFEDLNFHKNKKHNLLVLCKDCHRKKTNNEIIISQKMETNNGIKVNITNNYEKIINNLRKEGYSYNNIKKTLKNNYDYDLSIYKIKKYLK
jgi:DNA mismatch repair protein MutS